MSDADSDAELKVEDAELKKVEVVDETWSATELNRSVVWFRNAAQPKGQEGLESDPAQVVWSHEYP